ncbi:WW domain-binding protein 4, partial [Asbolus verrucosus]
ADYWVSQNRKYCDFCKCWITDNKPSVDFHEKGRRHQENVKKKLRNISRHSTQVQKDTDKFDATLKQIEFAALEAYRKDIETNGDLTSISINSKLQEGLVGNSSGFHKKLWNEMKTRDGKSYYVNIMTKETVWKPPKEGYASMEEQREQAHLEAKKQLKALEKYKRKEALLTMQEIKQNEAEESARRVREQMKERRVVDDTGPTTCGPLLEPGRTDPYGKWQTVKEREVVDLQLPQQEEYYEVPIEFEPEPIVKEFKEKTVESLGGGEAAFKRRRIGGGAKRNTRQRLDDD